MGIILINRIKKIQNKKKENIRTRWRRWCCLVYFNVYTYFFLVKVCLCFPFVENLFMSVFFYLNFKEGQGGGLLKGS